MQISVSEEVHKKTLKGTELVARIPIIAATPRTNKLVPIQKYYKAVYKALLAYGKKCQKSRLSFDFSACVYGEYISVVSRISDGEREAHFCDIFKNFIFWKPKIRDKNIIANAVKRKMRLGYPLYADAPSRAVKYFNKSMKCISESGRLYAVYSEGILGEKRTSVEIMTLAEIPEQK